MPSMRLKIMKSMQSDYEVIILPARPESVKINRANDNEKVCGEIVKVDQRV